MLKYDIDRLMIITIIKNNINIIKEYAYNSWICRINRIYMH